MCQFALSLKPLVGDDTTKIGVMATLRLVYQNDSKSQAPHFEIIFTKGLDDDQKEMMQKEIENVLAKHYFEGQEDDIILYNLYEDLIELVTTFNNSVKGRCYICFDQLCEDEQADFTDRPDLVRLFKCFHRFHLLCLYRDWFMDRHVEKDKFGGDIEYQQSEIKRCPICR